MCLRSELSSRMSRGMRRTSEGRSRSSLSADGTPTLSTRIVELRLSTRIGKPVSWLWCVIFLLNSKWKYGTYILLRYPKTPSPTSRFSHLSHQLSFHITLLLPASLTSLSSLSISLNRFRILFSPRLARKEFEWGDIDIRTTDAPVAVAEEDDSELTTSSERRSRSVSTSRVGSRSVSESPARLARGAIPASSSSSSLQSPTVWANRLTIYNTNRLDPDTTSLKNYLPSLSGSFVTRNAGPIIVRVANGSVYANLRSDGGGPVQVATTNFTLEGKFEGGKIDITNQNSPIVGSFITPVGSPSSSITIQNSVGKIEGSFAGHSISLSTANAPIDGLFEVPSSGGNLTLKNVGWRIDGTIRLVQTPAGGGPASVVPPSPALSDSASLHTVTSLPPAYSTTLTATKVLVETTDASVEIVYEGKGVIDSKVRTGRSHRAVVKHVGGGYSGAFAVSSHDLPVLSLHADSRKSGLHCTFAQCCRGFQPSRCHRCRQEGILLSSKEARDCRYD